MHLEALARRKGARDRHLGAAVGQAHDDARGRNLAVERRKKVKDLEGRRARAHLEVGVGRGGGGKRPLRLKLCILFDGNLGARGEVSEAEVKVKGRDRAEDFKCAVLGKLDDAALAKVVLRLGRDVDVSCGLNGSGHRNLGRNACDVVAAVFLEAALACLKLLVEVVGPGARKGPHVGILAARDAARYGDLGVDRGIDGLARAVAAS